MDLPAILPGSVCDCVRGGACFAVYVQSYAGKSAHCLSENDAKTHTLNPHWLFHPVERAAALKRGVDAQREELGRVAARRQELAAAADLPTLWELLEAEGHGGRTDFTAADLARLFFGDGAGADEAGGMLRALLADRLLFENRGTGFRPHSAARAEEIREAGRREERRLSRLRAFADAFAAGGPLPEGTADLAAQARSHFIRMPEKPSPDLREIFARAKVNPQSESQLHRALVRSGILPPLENYHLERHGIVRQPPAAAEAAAAALAAAGLPGGPRRDLTAQAAVTIDEASTVSYDDALFVETLAGERRALYIHIAGAGAVVPPDSPLFDAAVARATSAFFPGEKYEMLPDRLANEALSLVAGRERVALTLRIECEGEAVVGWELFESTIRVAENLAYADVDRGATAPLPAADHAFLERFAAARRAEREAAGALFVDRQELVIDLVDGEVRLRLQERAGSRLLVEECMIFANARFAEFCARRAIPAIYRHQAPLRPGPPPPEAAHPAVLAHHLRRRMAPSETGLSPRPHFSLGLSAYLQATSPIRRVTDLVTQMQMLRALRGEPTWNAERVEDLLFRSATGARDAALAERERRRFLVLSHAERNPDARYAAVVVDTARGVTVQVPLLESTAECGGLAKEKAPPGTEVEVAVARVDPPAGEIRFKP